MKTLLYILDYYLPHKGGVETVFEQIINRSLSSGYNVIVLTSRYDKFLPKEEVDGNLKVIRTGYTRKSFIWHGLLKGYKILKRNSNIIGIHTSTYGGAIPASILGLIFKKKVLLTVHEIFGKLWYRYKPWWSARIFLIFEWFIFKLPFDTYHCVSYYTLNCLRIYYGIPDKKLFLAHNGVDYGFRDKKKIEKKETELIRKKFGLDGKWNLLYFGHTGISKGIDLLVDSIPNILQENDNIQLIFNFIPAKRDSFIKDKIKSILSKLPTKDKGRVKIWNGLEKQELRALVANVEGVIAPSLSEGFGSVHTETLALGTPLITTYVASLPEVVGGNVLFFAPENKSSLCSTIRLLKKGDYTPLPEKRFSRDQQYIKLSEWYNKLK